MLKQLLIRNVALVDELILDLGQGLTVLTGETGAGKSIIVDSVNVLIGGRADRDLIRSGSQKAYIEGVFDISDNQNALSFMMEHELNAEDTCVILSREINHTGRTVCRINGMAVSLIMLKNFAVFLIDIHGQHEHQSLLDERKHLDFLDEFGDHGHFQLLDEVRQSASIYISKKKSFDNLKKKHAQRYEQLELLQIQKKELEVAKPIKGEEENLRRNLDELRNAGRINRFLNDAFSAVYDSQNGSNAALYLIQTASKALSEIAEYSKGFASLKDRLDSLYYEVEDVGLELRESIKSLDTDDNSLQKAAERLDVLKKLGRKYSVLPDELPEVLLRVQEELSQLTTLEDDLISMEKEVHTALNTFNTKASSLSESRKILASNLTRQMTLELDELNMVGTKFLIEFMPVKSEIKSTGQDDVRMLLSSNPGEEAKPLSKIASGGEISRLMLALKSISAQHNVIPTMIFDEIDTGISGRTAQVVAQKLWNIARFRQVMCVTHLQQIAVMGGTHLLVEKNEHEGRTLSSVKQLNFAERISEISRIISGYSENSQSSLQHAEHMLNEAEQYRIGIVASKSII